MYCLIVCWLFFCCCCCCRHSRRHFPHHRCRRCLHLYSFTKYISIGIQLMLANVSCCRPGHKTKRHALRFSNHILTSAPLFMLLTNRTVKEHKSSRGNILRWLFVTHLIFQHSSLSRSLCFMQFLPGSQRKKRGRKIPWK